MTCVLYLLDSINVRNQMSQTALHFSFEIVFIIMSEMNPCLSQAGQWNKLLDFVKFNVAFKVKF